MNKQFLRNKNCQIKSLKCPILLVLKEMKIK